MRARWLAEGAPGSIGQVGLGRKPVVQRVAVTVNGERRIAEVYPEQLLVYFLSVNLGLERTKVGCHTGTCGACAVLLDGERVKSCMVRAVDADEREVTTFEAMAPPTHADLIEAVRSEGVVDERVLAAVAAVPRAGFVPSELVDRAYVDTGVQISDGQSSTYPSLVARIAQSLELTGSEKVLEIGTGLGYQTALLAQLAESVWSVEWWEGLVESARANLARAGIDNAWVARGDGTKGLPEQAPFDAIVVSAAHPTVPTPLAEQLGRGGRLVQPIGQGGDEDVAVFVREERALVLHDSVGRASFACLYEEWAY